MADKKEPLPDFSDVRGGGSSSAYKRPDVGEAERTYTVKKGDSLSKIAKAVYGSTDRWQAIYEANKDTIKNPDLIYPGQVIKLPNV